MGRKRKNRVDRMDEYRETALVKPVPHAPEPEPEPPKEDEQKRTRVRNVGLVPSCPNCGGDSQSNGLSRSYPAHMGVRENICRACGMRFNSRARVDHEIL